MIKSLGRIENNQKESSQSTNLQKSLKPPFLHPFRSQENFQVKDF